MAKEVPTIEVAPKVQPTQKSERPKDKTKLWAKAVQMGLGVDLLGSKMSLAAKRDSTLEVTPLGIKATSGKNGRVVLVPWANIRGCELFTED